VFPYTETGDRTFTRMQRPGERPLLADPATKYPLIVLSGGYNTHGLWHLFRLKDLAAHGFIVLDLFHGDGRSGSLPANLALRGLALQRALDYLLADPAFGPAIDAERIGVIGESAGAHTAFAALGGTDPSGRVPAAADPRIKAAVGVVPFLGTSFGFWPFTVDAWHFGENYAGLKKITRPSLALYGGRDTSVTPERVEAGVRALAGPTLAVRLDEEGHLLSDAAQRDARAWELLFFNAWLRGDVAAREQLQRADSVQGGARDRVTYRHLPAAAGP
jgi:predicted dienelactone hydrolase